MCSYSAIHFLCTRLDLLGTRLSGNQTTDTRNLDARNARCVGVLDFQISGQDAKHASCLSGLPSVTKSRKDPNLYAWDHIESHTRTSGPYPYFLSPAIAIHCSDLRSHPILWLMLFPWKTHDAVPSQSPALPRCSSFSMRGCGLVNAAKRAWEGIRSHSSLDWRAWDD